LTQTSLQTSAKDQTPISDLLIDADFRQRRDVPSVLSAAEHTILGDATSLLLDPPTWSATKTATTHRVDARTLYLDGEAKETRHYACDAGARRTSDGVWTYTFNLFDRLTSATSTKIGRRIEYTWDPNNRLVGRAAFRTDGTGQWVTEDRTNSSPRTVSLPTRRSSGTPSPTASPRSQ
jgi:YD repeat-containing protein